MLVHNRQRTTTNSVARHQPSRHFAVENIRAELDRDQVEKLLVILCERFGFCLPPMEQERIIGNPPLTVNDFTDAVLLGDGIDPAIADKKLVEAVRALVAGAFVKASASGESK